MTRNILTILDIPGDEARAVLGRARELKAGSVSRALDGKTVVLIFEKSSTRTRISFEVGVRQLGGTSLLMTPAESQLGRNEPLEDTARVLSRYVDCLVVRTFEHQKLVTLAENGSIPVINALCDDYHPCQVMSDVLTMYERTPDFEDVAVAWVGDGNNMANSFINAARYFPFTLRMAVPEGYDPDPEVFDRAVKAGARVSITRDPAEAVAGAHYVNTDVWASMGEESEQARREKDFAGFQVDAELMKLAAPDAKFMHCLPAHRGEEVSAEVFESPASIVFDQAENRLHMQKAMLEWVFGAI